MPANSLKSVIRSTQAALKAEEDIKLRWFYIFIPERMLNFLISSRRVRARAYAKLKADRLEAKTEGIAEASILKAVLGACLVYGKEKINSRHENTALLFDAHYLSNIFTRFCNNVSMRDIRNYVYYKLADILHSKLFFVGNSTVYINDVPHNWGKCPDVYYYTRTFISNRASKAEDLRADLNNTYANSFAKDIADSMLKAIKGSLSFIYTAAEREAKKVDLYKLYRGALVEDNYAAMLAKFDYATAVDRFNRFHNDWSIALQNLEKLKGVLLQDDIFNGNNVAKSYFFEKFSDILCDYFVNIMEHNLVYPGCHLDLKPLGFLAEPPPRFENRVVPSGCTLFSTKRSEHLLQKAMQANAANAALAKEVEQPNLSSSRTGSRTLY